MGSLQSSVSRKAMIAPISSATEKKPSTLLAFFAAAMPLPAFIPGLIWAMLASSSPLEQMWLMAGSSAWAVVGATLFCSVAVSALAFCAGRLVRIPAPVLAVFVTLPALVGATGVMVGLKAMFEAIANVHPADKATIMLQGSAEALQAAVMGCCLGAACSGAAAAALFLAALARGGESDKGYRWDLVASGAVLLGGFGIWLMQGVLAGNLAHTFVGVANVNLNDRLIVLTAAEVEVASNETRLKVAWVLALVLMAVGSGLAFLRAKRISGLVTAVLVFGAAAFTLVLIDDAQRPPSGARVGPAEVKMLRVEGRLAFAQMPWDLRVSGDEVFFDGAKPSIEQLAEEFSDMKQRYEDLHAIAAGDDAANNSWAAPVVFEPDATASGVAKLLQALRTAGVERFELIGKAEQGVSKGRPVAARLKSAWTVLESGLASIDVGLIDAKAVDGCKDCVRAVVEGNQLLMGAERVPLQWATEQAELRTGKAIFDMPKNDLQGWVMALSAAEAKAKTPVVIVP